MNMHKTLIFALLAFAASTSFAEESLHYTLISPPAYTNEWQAYLDMRATQRSDVEFKLVNAMDIYTNELYRFNASATAGAPRNPAESIHAWIRGVMKGITAENERAKHYFVLGGSFVNAQAITSMEDSRLQTKIPSVYIQTRHAGSVDLIDEHQDHPVSDMFYACLDVAEGKWPWDGNANGKYADTNELGNDVNDFYADVIIARIPIDKHPKATPQQVIAAFAEKVRRVEAEDFAGNYHFAAAGGQVAQTFNMKKNPGRVIREEREFYDGGLNYFDPRHGGQWLDAEELPRRTVKDMVVKRRPVLEGNPLFVYGWGADHASIDAAVNHYYSHDRDFVEYRDHGSGEDLYCKYINVDRYLNATGITRMIFSGFSCMTGHLDSNYLSLGEAEIESLNGGTVASVHNSRFGFGTNNVNNDDDGLSSSLQYYMKDAVLNKDMDMGSAWLDARHRYYNRGSAYPVGRFCLAEQILFGDPLIKLPPAISETTIDAANLTVEKDTGYTTLKVKGDATGAVRISGEKLFKVMKKLNVEGKYFTFAANGGVGGEGINFVDGKGILMLASSDKSYFVQPTGASIVSIDGSGITLDMGDKDPTFEVLKLVGEGGQQTGNVIRGRKAGQLKTFTPLAVGYTEVALGTVDAFKNGDFPYGLASVSHGALGITFNPNYGSADSWEYFQSSIRLSGGTLFVDRTETAGFGRPDKPGLIVSVSGDSAVKTMNGGKATLFGTSTFNLTSTATLNLAATFAPDTATNGKLVINGGRTVVTDGYGLSGEVDVNDGTLVLNEIPLKNVTKLSLSGTSKLVIPMDGTGFYQILSAKGASLELADGVTVSASANENTPVQGQTTSNGAFFDQSLFKIWDKPTGSDWEASWSGDQKVYFPEIEGEVVVNLPADLSCAFVAFGNENGTYRFTGKRLTLGNAILSNNIVFENEVYSPLATEVSSGNVVFSTLRTPRLEITDGAVVSAANIVNEIKTIKALRFYPLKTNGGDGQTAAIYQLQFNTSNGTLPLGSATFSYPTELGSVQNPGYLCDGNIAGIQDWNGTLCCTISVSDSAYFAGGRFYLQYMFADAQPMPTSFGIAASANGNINKSQSLTDFRIDVTADGVNWVTVREVSNAAVPGTGLGEMWYSGSATAFGINNPPADIYVEKGGSLELSGSVSGTIHLEAESILKVGSGAMTLGTGSKIVVPEEGVAVIDCSAVNLTDTSTILTILSGVTLTEQEIAHLTTSGKPWMKLELNNGSLVLKVDKKPQKILFR